MADTRLSDLSSASALSASDLFYVVQSAGSGGEKATGTQLLTLVGTTYVAKAGGTMTGALTLPAGSAAAPALMFTGAGSNTGFYSAGANDVSLAINGSRVLYGGAGYIWIPSEFGLSATSAIIYFSGTGNTTIVREGTGTLAFRGATAQQIVRMYNTYTDGNNYERLTLTGVAGTSVNITAETLGTGGDNLDIVLTPAGTGVVKLYNGLTLMSGGISATGAGIVGSFFQTANAGAYVMGNDIGLARNAAGVFEVNSTVAGTYRDLKLRNLIQTEYSQMTEMTAPAAPATNSVRIYAEDNGSGKTRLMALFATGVAQQIAIEP